MQSPGNIVIGTPEGPTEIGVNAGGTDVGNGVFLRSFRFLKLPT